MKRDNSRICAIRSRYKYIIGCYKPTDLDYDLAFHITYVVSVNFIHLRRDLQSTPNYRYLQNFRTFTSTVLKEKIQKSAKRRAPENFFYHFSFCGRYLWTAAFCVISQTAAFGYSNLSIYVASINVQFVKCFVSSNFNLRRHSI